MKKVIIAGAGGFVGRALKAFLIEKGYNVIALVRHRDQEGIYWNPSEKIIDLQSLEDCECIINLCGESLFGRWTKAKIKRLFASRLLPTSFLCLSLKELKKPPKCYIGASAIGFYGNRGEEVLTEESGGGTGVLSSLCLRWESFPLELLKNTPIRTVLFRFGIVLGKNGGILKKMEGPFKRGLGATLGEGKQLMSWISMDDLLQLFAFAIENQAISGLFNAVCPETVSNKEFSEALAKHFGHLLRGSIPTFLLKLIFSRGAEAFVSSQKVVPKKLLENGFHFKDCRLEHVFKKYLPN